MEILNEIKLLGAFLYLKHPFYNYFLSRVTFSLVTDELSTEFGIYSPNYDSIFISPEWAEKTIKKNIKVFHYHIIHEILHIAFMHKHRRLTRDPLKWDAACDLVIDNIITHDSVLKSLCVFDSDVSNILDAEPKISESVEDLYLRIKFRDGDSKCSSKKDNCSSTSETSKKKKSSGKPSNNHISWNAGQCESTQCDAEARFISATDFASMCDTRFEPTHGGTIGETVEILSELRRPKASILAFLNKIVKSYISYQSSYKRGDRRYLHNGLIVPSKIKNVKHFKLLFYVDTSGSVDSSDLAFMFGEIHHILSSLSSFEIDVIQSDTGIGCINKFTQKTSFSPDDFLNVYGRGGTEFAPLFEHLTENTYDVVITFSDFYISKSDLDSLVSLDTDNICVLNTTTRRYHKEYTKHLKNVFNIADATD